jgi:hypothetical protein
MKRNAPPILYASMLGLGIALVALLFVLLHLLIPSEISTPVLVGVLLAVISVTGFVIWLVLEHAKLADAARFAIAGVGLLSVGTALAFAMLPEHHATGTLAGAVGVLPPWPAKEGRGFTVGLATHLNGCSESVAVKLVVNGSRAYWADQNKQPRAWDRFVVVLPGRFTNVRLGLGRVDTMPLRRTWRRRHPNGNCAKR